MEIGELSGIVGAPIESRSVLGQTSLAEDFDTFLNLLTTQLQNQDPLNPMDSTQFTEQLVSFANVEQQINQNSLLEDLLVLQKVDRASSAVSFLGKLIEAEGDSTALTGESALWTYTLPENAENVTLSVTDSAGRLVFQSEGETAAGRHEFLWDGRDQSGVLLPEGIYTLGVSAESGEGDGIAAETTIFGIAKGLETVNDEIVLTVDSQSIPLIRVLSVREAPAPVTGNPNG